MATFSGSILGSTVPADPRCAEVVGDYMVVVYRGGAGAGGGVLGSGTYAVRDLSAGTVKAYGGLSPLTDASFHATTVLDGRVWVVNGTSLSRPIEGIDPTDGSRTAGPISMSGFGVAAGGRIWHGTSTLNGWSPSTNTTVTTPSNVHSNQTATAYGSDRLYTYRSSDGLIREIDTDTGDVVATHPSPAACSNRGVVIGDHIWWASNVGGTLVRFHVPTGDAVALSVTPPGLIIPSVRPRLGADGTIWWIDRVTLSNRARITVVNTSTMQWAQGDSPLAYEGPFAWAMHNGLPIIAYAEPTS